ncbi:DNA-binding protein [Acidobacteriota bacterium]
MIKRKIVYILCLFSALIFTVQFNSVSGASTEKLQMSDQKPLPNQEVSLHRGPVTTTLKSGGYTYIEFEMDGRRIWVAAPEFEVEVGDIIQFSSGMTMKDFYSKTLDRTFDVILFVNQIQIEGKTGATPQEKAMGLSDVHSGRNMNPVSVPSVEPGSVKKAQDGYTVKECFEQKDTLAGKTIKIRGRVVKFTAKILGRNFLHIKDGTGVEGSNDLTVTTKTVVAVGDMVLVSGVLSLERNFGMGFIFPVILEDAEVRIEDK